LVVESDIYFVTLGLVPDHLDIAAVAATALHLDAGDHHMEVLLRLVRTAALRADVDPYQCRRT
jgi:hypothetical protein